MKNPEDKCIYTCKILDGGFGPQVGIKRRVLTIILLHEKFLQFDWLRAVVFQLNLKYLHVKITNLLRVVV